MRNAGVRNGRHQPPPGAGSAASGTWPSTKSHAKAALVWLSLRISRLRLVSSETSMRRENSSS